MEEKFLRTLRVTGAILFSLGYLLLMAAATKLIWAGSIVVCIIVIAMMFGASFWNFAHSKLRLLSGPTPSRFREVTLEEMISKSKKEK